MVASSVTEIYQTLRTKHFASNELAIGAVCTRVALRTGVSLRSVKPQQDRDPKLVAETLRVLADLGYAL